jgi:hypothetical protein
MKKLISIVVLSLSVSTFASEDRMAEVPMFGFEKKEILRDSVSVKAPPQKEMETEKVISVETPFQTVAWENKVAFNDEFRIMNLGIGF